MYYCLILRMHYFARLALFGICGDVHYATVDRHLEFVGGAQRSVEADDRPGCAEAEQDNEHRRPDDTCRRFTG